MKKNYYDNEIIQVDEDNIRNNVDQYNHYKNNLYHQNLYLADPNYNSKSKSLINDNFNINYKNNNTSIIRSVKKFNKNDNDDYEIVEISYINENNQIRNLEKLVPVSNRIYSKSKSCLNSINYIDNFNNDNDIIKVNNCKNLRNELRNFSRSNSQNFFEVKYPRFSNKEIPSVIDEEYVNNRIRKTEISIDNNNYNFERQIKYKNNNGFDNENQTEIDIENNIDYNQKNNYTLIKDIDERREWYSIFQSIKFPSLKFPNLEFPSIEYPNLKCHSLEFPSFNFPSINYSPFKFLTFNYSIISTGCPKIKFPRLDIPTSKK